MYSLSSQHNAKTHIETSAYPMRMGLRSMFSRFGFTHGHAAAALRLACLFGLLAAVWTLSGFSASAEEMSFNVVTLGNASICGQTCPAVIAASGEITNQTPNAFLAFLQHTAARSSVHTIVLLDSPGGKVVASMELGHILRRLGAAAVVARVDANAPGALLPGRCFSACVYTFIGGKKRVIPSQSELGIHRMFAYEAEAGLSGMFGQHYRRLDDGGMKSVLAHYSRVMGVNPQIIFEAERIMPDHIHIVSRSEISRWHLGVSHF